MPFPLSDFSEFSQALLISLSSTLPWPLRKILSWHISHSAIVTQLWGTCLFHLWIDHSCKRRSEGAEKHRRIDYRTTSWKWKGLRPNHSQWKRKWRSRGRLSSWSTLSRNQPWPIWSPRSLGRFPKGMSSKSWRHGPTATLQSWSTRD